MGKYLFFDIDGTLISKKTIKEIKQTCKIVIKLLNV